MFCVTPSQTPGRSCGKRTDVGISADGLEIKVLIICSMLLPSNRSSLAELVRQQQRGGDEKMSITCGACGHCADVQVNIFKIYIEKVKRRRHCPTFNNRQKEQSTVSKYATEHFCMLGSRRNACDLSESFFF